MDAPTIAALVISICSAMFTGWQALEGRRIRKFSEELAKNQADDSRRTAELAKRSSEAAELSARTAAMGQRAWVLVTEAPGDFDLRPDHLMLKAKVTLRNTGRTPAIGLRTWQKAEIRTSPPSESDYPSELTEGTLGHLPAGEFCQIPATLEPNVIEFGPVVGGTAKAYIYGVAEYGDLVFNNSKNRTQWSLEYEHAAKQFRYSATCNRAS